MSLPVPPGSTRGTIFPASLPPVAARAVGLARADLPDDEASELHGASALELGIVDLHARLVAADPALRVEDPTDRRDRAALAQS
jgi:hypothetical protein